MLRSLVNLLYPPRHRCASCGRDAQKVICTECMSMISFIESTSCLKCGKRLGDGYSGFVCPDCGKVRHEYDMAYACFDYEGMGKKIIHLFKYEGKKEISLILGKLAADKIIEESIIADAIVPVPIHKSKLESRGFNQALLLAERVSDMTGIPVADCLVRKKETQSQYALDKSRRHANVFDAFDLNLSYNVSNYRDVILIDDIYTTGSTADACSKVLKKKGISAVYVVTTATGSNT